MYSAIASNKRRTILVMSLFIIIIGLLGLLAGAIYNELWITVGTIIGAGAYALIQYFAASREVLAMTGAREIQRGDFPDLYNLVENLVISQGMPMPKVYIVQDASPNAFATGNSPDKAAVAVTTGLLEILNKTELEGVIAHELGHIKNFDVRLNMVVFGLVVAIGFLADMLFRMAFYSRNNKNSHPAIMIVGLVAMIIAPIVAALVQAAVSRQREFLADATGALITRYPEGLASALEKIEAAAIPLQHQSTSMSHLWFSNPLKGGLNKLFATHPATADRVQRLRTIGGGF